MTTLGVNQTIGTIGGGVMMILIKILVFLRPICSWVIGWEP